MSENDDGIRAPPVEGQQPLPEPGQAPGRGGLDSGPRLKVEEENPEEDVEYIIDYERISRRYRRSMACYAVFALLSFFSGVSLLGFFVYVYGEKEIRIRANPAGLQTFGDVSLYMVAMVVTACLVSGQEAIGFPLPQYSLSIHFPFSIICPNEGVVMPKC